MFRGKRVDSGKWVHGCLGMNTDGNHYIGLVEPRYIDDGAKVIDTWEVISKTIGQCTGLTTFSDILIYEGDVLQYKDVTGRVAWVSGCWAIVCSKYVYTRMNMELLPNTFSLKDGWYLVGNVHDNPELIKGEQNDES